MTSFFRLLFCVGIIFGTFIFFQKGYSLDVLAKKYLFPPQPAKMEVEHLEGEDWRVVQGVRWFKIKGKDSAGTNYEGWISELAFMLKPPEFNDEPGDFFTSVGLPSIKERVSAAKQLKLTIENIDKQMKVLRSH